MAHSIGGRPRSLEGWHTFRDICLILPMSVRSSGPYIWKPTWSSVNIQQHFTKTLTFCVHVISRQFRLYFGCLWHKSKQLWKKVYQKIFIFHEDRLMSMCIFSNSCWFALIYIDFALDLLYKSFTLGTHTDFSITPNYT